MNNSSDINKKQRLVFNLLLLYIIAALVWWGYLLLVKIGDNYHARLTHLELQYAAELSPEKVQEKATRLDALDTELRQQRAMIFGEGATFLSLILLGAFLVRRYFQKEIQLAHRQRNFLLSITHELKSPLASSRLNLQTIGLRDLPKEKLMELVQYTEQDIDRLDRLVQKLLLGARIEDMQQLVDKQQVDLHDLCSQVVLQQHKNPSNNRQISTALEHVSIYGDGHLIEVAVNNLLENALKYSPEGTAVEVSALQQDGMAIVRVSDRGKTIPEAEHRKIFDRFYRIGNEDTRTSTGTGLGLYIVSKVAALHGGSISVANREGGGNVFTLAFPA